VNQNIFHVRVIEVYNLIGIIYLGANKTYIYAEEIIIIKSISIYYNNKVIFKLIERTALKPFEIYIICTDMIIKLK